VPRATSHFDTLKDEDLLTAGAHPEKAIALKPNYAQAPAYRSGDSSSTARNMLPNSAERAYSRNAEQSRG
jgi:hypothetical protein